jgi:hypothetical protein
MLSLFDSRRAAQMQALRDTALERALAASPDRWEVHAQQGELLRTRRDWRGAAAAYSAAERLGPTDPALWGSTYGDFLANVGRTREATALYLAARDRDPLGIYVAMGVSWNLDIAGRPKEATTEYNRAISMGGERSLGALVHVARLLREAEHDTLRDFLADYPDERPGRQEFAREFARVWMDREAALALIRSIGTNPAFSGPNDLPGFASLAAHYGDADLALEMLREDYLERGGYFTIFLWSSDLAEARRTRRFKDLVRDVGLVAFWRESGNWGEYCQPRGQDDFDCR